jgi:hypothetical protein
VKSDLRSAPNQRRPHSGYTEERRQESAEVHGQIENPETPKDLPSGLGGENQMVSFGKAVAHGSDHEIGSSVPSD